MTTPENPYILDVQKNTYHIVLKRATLRFHGAVACHFIVGIGKLIVVARVQKLGYVSLGVGRPQEKPGLVLKPPKILHPWSTPMSCTMEVVMSA
jgi:hypothetical protein